MSEISFNRHEIKKLEKCTDFPIDINVIGHFVSFFSYLKKLQIKFDSEQFMHIFCLWNENKRFQKNYNYIWTAMKCLFDEQNYGVYPLFSLYSLDSITNILNKNKKNFWMKIRNMKTIVNMCKIL